MEPVYIASVEMEDESWLMASVLWSSHQKKAES